MLITGYEAWTLLNTLPCGAAACMAAMVPAVAVMCGKGSATAKEKKFEPQIENDYERI